MLCSRSSVVQQRVDGRVPVCHYPVDHRARAFAHRTGFSRSGRWSTSLSWLGSALRGTRSAWRPSLGFTACVPGWYDYVRVSGAFTKASAADLPPRSAASSFASPLSQSIRA